MSQTEVAALAQKTLESSYLFLRNDVIRLVDPSGLDWIKVPVYKRTMGIFAGKIGVPHMFLEYYGESAGFVPAGDKWYEVLGGPGKVTIPDEFGGNEEKGWHDSIRFKTLWIDNCCIDPDKLKKNLIGLMELMKNETSMIYIAGFYDCRDLAYTVIPTALSISAKDDSPWLCKLFSNYAWYVTLGND